MRTLLKVWKPLLVVALATAILTSVAWAVTYRYRATVQMTGTITTDLVAGLTASPSVDFQGWAPGIKSPVRTVEVTNVGDVTLSRLTFAAEGLPPGVTFLVSYTPRTPVGPGGKWQVYLQLEAATSVPNNTTVTGRVRIDGE